MKGAHEVHATRCGTYEPDVLRNHIRDHLGRYPGYGDLKGKRVLLKPNLLSAVEPEAGVTTHPEFLKQVIIELQDRGASCVIGDSPGGAFTRPVLKRAYEMSGFSRVAEETGASLNYNTSSRKVRWEKGRFTKVFEISEYILDADTIISLPKLKTHMLTGLTCATKNMFGAVPGTTKVTYHTRFPEPVEFCKMLHDLAYATGLGLSIVDGIIGMEGSGPRRGEPREVGLIASGTHPEVLDLFLARAVGLDPERLPMLKAAGELDMIDLRQEIRITGDGADFGLDPPFKPAGGWFLISNPPRALRRMVVSASTRKPLILTHRCVGCGVCAKNCAGDAITLKGGKAVIDYGKCIRCYCCHELCPHGSVSLTRSISPIGRAISRSATLLVDKIIR